MEKRLLTIFTFLMLLATTTGAQVTIHGIVVDEENEPMIGVSLSAKDTNAFFLDVPLSPKNRNNGTSITDIDGKFTIEVPQEGAKIWVNYPGYQPTTVQAKDGMVVNMKEEKKLKPRQERRSIQLTDDDRAAIKGINSLSLRLLATLGQHKSTIMSPLSIACLLSLTSNGASGKTQREICHLLKCTPEVANSLYHKLTPFLTDSRYGSRFNMANALFVNPAYPLKALFRQVAADDYSAFISQDMNVKTVNDWCARQTSSMIPSIIEQIPDETSLVALNTVFFESLWKKEFDEKETKEEPFSREDGTRRLMPVMHQKGIYSYGRGDNFSILTKEYKGEVNYKMTIFLPDEGCTLGQMLSQLTEEKWQEARRTIGSYRVDVKLPRFKTETELQLTPTMKQLGIQAAFLPAKADFRRLADNKSGLPIYISDMKQKAIIEVNEKGTRAAAATAEIVIVGYGRTHYEDRIFHAKRPFAYMIRETYTDTILFIGTYYGD